jgi:heme-degrading monooxygenase HmoA
MAVSVLVTIRVDGDTDKFRSLMESEGDRVRSISEQGRAQGCLHHRFAIGDGFVVVIDEWETAEQFQGFFEGNEEIAAVMRDAGAQSAPQVTVMEAISTPDQF